MMWISLSLVAWIFANLAYQFDDSVLVKSTGQIGTNLISIFGWCWLSSDP
jgi:hypothetical protein